MSENALYIIRLIDFNDSVFKYYMINLPSLKAVSKKTICRKSNRNKMTKDDIVSSVQMIEDHQFNGSVHRIQLYERQRYANEYKRYDYHIGCQQWD